MKQILRILAQRGLLRLLAILLISGTGLLTTNAAQSAEVDQFTTQSINLADSLPLINQRINSYLKETIWRLRKNSSGCEKKPLYRELRKYLNNHLKGEVIHFLETSSRIDRASLKISESIYGGFKLFDGPVLARKGADNSALALSSIIHVGENRIGIDKLEHFFGNGFVYFKALSNETPIENILMRGITIERVILGGNRLLTGVFSYADLIANFNGMRFWNRLLGEYPDAIGESNRPYLTCVDNHWEIESEIDINHFIDQTWDESINCSTFATKSAVQSIKDRMQELEIECRNAEVEKYKTKYGVYSDFLLNLNGIGQLTKLGKLRKELGFNRGWEKLPTKFLPYILKPNPNLLEYYYPDRYQRRIRSLKNRNRKIKNESSYLNVNPSSIVFDPNTPDQIIRCWNTLVTGGDCEEDLLLFEELYKTDQGTLDPLLYLKDVSYYHGLVTARDELIRILKTRDHSKGEIRDRIMQTTSDTNFVFPDSLSTIPLSERKEIGVFFILGFGGDGGDNAELIRLASDEVSKSGFTSSVLEVDPKLGSDYNALILKKSFPKLIKPLKKVVIIGASKGVSDVLTYFLNYPDSLTQVERDKIRAFVSLSGVIRGSIVAKFVADGLGPLPFLARALMSISGNRNFLKGIKSLAKDPWEGHARDSLKRNFQNLKWISFAAVPENETATTSLCDWSKIVENPVFRSKFSVSPNDCLVESAAAILPPDTGIEETIVPVFGPHALALGSYSKTLKIAPHSQIGDPTILNPDSGSEILDAMFRALPISLLSD